jgi:hypothetical protein
VEEVPGGEATVVKRVEGGSDEVYRCVVFTDSNGRDMVPENIKAYIRKDKRDRFDVRVEVVYTLMETWDKVERGVLKVEGKTVILDVSTKDVRGTKRVPRSRPDEVGRRFEGVARLLLDKSAVRVVGCEVKPMNFMDVTPYSWAIHSACLWLRTLGHQVHGCQTHRCKSPEEGRLSHLSVFHHCA